MSARVLYADALAEMYTDWAGKNKKSAYMSSHWDESNVVAHIRVNDRRDADGKRVLFVEEIQSDWAQKGRKEGFASDGIDTAGWTADHRHPAGHTLTNLWTVRDARGTLVVTGVPGANANEAIAEGARLDARHGGRR